ncbi:hypothetical protein [Stygiobacter electus]|uniref:Anti-bacteriophage protein A/HamA C-terminal domain-containing protein n=1 Tax=Stygiobacter electus TaxID=3032292 RepID=A0AAE3P343_9BACT|nr:hypothetical protein [Stygiobacter electus]MDF1612892.1 hypothetical protein [Stygiobacter electus]
MNRIYQHIDSAYRGYDGVSFDEAETGALLSGKVKDALIDRPQRQKMLSMLETLQQDTGFQQSSTLLQDIQALQNEDVDVQTFRVGEALAEVVMQEHFSCRFYWNELRDARNPKGNKTGADLVGFIEIDNQVLFLFGEVKTSSETKSPPQVMTNAEGIENQLRDLYNDPQKRLILISYIQSKLQPVGNEDFKEDFEKAIRTYYQQNAGKYLLYGVLVRDTESDENDIKASYDKLKQDILDPIGLKLLAIYLPIAKENWLKIINGAVNESN